MPMSSPLRPEGGLSIGISLWNRLKWYKKVFVYTHFVIESQAIIFSQLFFKTVFFFLEYMEHF